MTKLNIKTKKPNFTRPILLLHPQIPKPMHGINPRSVMGKEWWDKHRKEAQEKNNFHCWACGIHRSKAKYHNWLEGHESYKINYAKGSMELEEIVSLCHSCHNFIHSGRLEILRNNGEITYEKFNDIIVHGNNITKDIDVSLMTSANGHFAEWKKWHLLIDGEKFYSKFRNMTEWENYYGR